MACSCNTLTPFQRLSIVYNELMGIREDLEIEGYTCMTKICAEVDSILMAIQPADQTVPIPLYTGLCDAPESHRAGV